MKRKLRSACIIFVAIAILMAARACAWQNDEPVRIGLLRFNKATNQLNISSLSLCVLTRAETDAEIATITSPFTIETRDKTIVAKPESGDSIECGPTVRISLRQPAGTLRIKADGVSQGEYRGSVEIVSDGDKLKVVNVVDVEDYLMGVLPAEMGPSYPYEALRAQAITARTYTLSNRGKHAAQGFDLCDGTHCQTYVGVASEKARCSQAITDTRGQVLTYDSELAEVMYSADCGGATVNYAEYRPGSNFPYLKGSIDPDDIPRIQWEQGLTLQEIGRKLASYGVGISGEVCGIKITKTGLFGRAMQVEISDAGSRTIVAADKLRRALGLKSTMFTIEAGGEGKVKFKGKGSGHGVGLCQTGAKGLASPPHNFNCAQILSHYFPGTQISGERLSTPPNAANMSKVPIEHRIITVAKLPEAREPAEVTTADSDRPTIRIQAPDRL